MRAGISKKWWIANQCLSMTETKNPMLVARAEGERRWLEKIVEISAEKFVIIPWMKTVSVKNVTKN
jgi:arsenite/tail-anchored protein-transporting ATPase